MGTLRQSRHWLYSPGKYVVLPTETLKLQTLQDVTSFIVTGMSI